MSIRKKEILAGQKKYAKKPAVFNDAVAKKIAGSLRSTKGRFVDSYLYSMLHGVCKATAQRALRKLRQQHGIPRTEKVPLAVYCQSQNLDIDAVDVWMRMAGGR